MNNILITGANGYIGNIFSKKCQKLLGQSVNKIVATDIREPENKLSGVIYETADIRSEKMHDLIKQYQITTVVHLAAIISVTGNIPREKEYDIDVNGSYNIIEACLKHQVKRFITTSSGAAYGYWPINVDKVLTEDMPIRGNFEIPYSHHKYLVEERLKKVREDGNQLEQYIFRVGTILGKTTSNPITDYLKTDKLLVFKGYHSSFVFIWDDDLGNILLKAALGNGKPGIYNVAGNGALDPRYLAQKMNKNTREIRAAVARMALKILKSLGLTQYPPEQIKFIQFRPVLDNTKLKQVFSYIPKKTSEEVFDYWWNFQK